MSEIPRGDGVGEHRRAAGPRSGPGAEPSEQIPRDDEQVPWETSAEDVVEQRAEVAPEEIRVTVPGQQQWEVDPADAAEQESEVPIDEEEWR